MHSALEDLKKTLELLQTTVESSWDQDLTFTETWGWNFPPLTRHDLSRMAGNLAMRISENPLDKLPEENEAVLHALKHSVQVYIDNTSNYLYNGHGQTAVPIFVDLISSIENELDDLYGWTSVNDRKLLPKNLARRLRSIEADLNDLCPDKEKLADQIKLINEATETAESLPTDLQKLKDVKVKINALSDDAKLLHAAIEKIQLDSDKASQKIQGNKEQTDKLVENCEEAYRITTSKGLAGAFDQRARELYLTMWVWVVGLICALLAGTAIGSSRFNSILKLANGSDPEWNLVWINLILSILGLAAPIWFAWIATKQIAQRFKLAEDYAFKSSVAKAYEGYRKEAVDLSEDFMVRLFGAALTRLEEPPLRFLDQDNHGSPWHELIESDSFKSALRKFPDLKDRLLSIIPLQISKSPNSDNTGASDA